MSGYEGNLESPITIGVSACLLGQKVRYDGGHKHYHYLTDTLGKFFRFLPVCPEVECGLPIPREAMRLEGTAEEPRLVTSRTGRDLTGQMLDYCNRRVDELAAENLCGFVFKKDSPSSGLFRVRVYRKGSPARDGRGLFAAAVVTRLPLLPAEEEGRLGDENLRENFIERVFAYHRWKDFLAGKAGVGELVQFHTAHKLQLMAHHPETYRQLGKLVAAAKGVPRQELLARYEELFMTALSYHATARKNTDVLQHIMGYFKKELTKEEKAELGEVIEQYHRRLVPLVVPLTLLKHYVHKYGIEYLQKQWYLQPHPMELMLRNHV
jgi:uncharacterized protein YbgA (DUF1722 family)/uncharacterized protein YbbK (DUF523 family)